MTLSLDNLIEQLEKSPEDLDLINRVAMGYYQNPGRIADNEALKFFETAYFVQNGKALHIFLWLVSFSGVNHKPRLPLAFGEPPLSPKYLPALLPLFHRISI